MPGDAYVIDRKPTLEPSFRHVGTRRNAHHHERMNHAVAAFSAVSRKTGSTAGRLPDETQEQLSPRP
jgi:hypothetical protein